MTMLLAVVSGFIMAAFAPWITPRIRPVAGWFYALLPAGLFAWFATFLPEVAAGNSTVHGVEWVPQIGVNLTFLIDGLSLTFALLITGIGTCVMAYAGGYMKEDPNIGRFFMSLNAFMAAMLGVVLSNNLISLFVFWELTSISSYMLIGFNHEDGESREAAIHALILTGMGGLAMLAGFLIIQHLTGTAELAEILGGAGAILDSGMYKPILLLVLAGAFTKSAQFPFHFWLPGAMQAPTPVSAYLHSATMVKAGVYLLARMHPVLGGTDLWMFLLTGVGTVTMLVGATISLMRTDVKQVLAGSTIMALGALVMLLGIGTEIALMAMSAFLVVHCLYKAALFMVAGAIDHGTGTRELALLGGLRSKMPMTFAGAVLAAISMAGLPPFIGFVGKELIYGALLEAPRMMIILIVSGIIANAFMVAVGGLLAINPFFGKLKETPTAAHEVPAMMWIGPALLGVVGLVFGLMTAADGNQISSHIVTPMTEAMMGMPPASGEVALWHGFNTALLLSIVTVAIGVAVWKFWWRLQPGFAALDGLFFSGEKAGYVKFVDGVMSFAGWQTRVMQSGYLRRYVMVMLAMIFLATMVPFFRGGAFAISAPVFDSPYYFYEVILCMVIIAGAIGTLMARHHLVLIISLGTVGYSVALLYVAFGAPDLAMTQFLVETLSVILVALILIRVPEFYGKMSKGSRMRDGLLAGGFGLAMMLIILALGQLEFSQHLTDFYAEASFAQAHGRNIVNVILVDFRGVDTMGEITVLATAGTGIYALLKLRASKKRDETREEGESA